MNPEEKPRAIAVLKHAYHVEGDVNALRELAWILADDGDQAGSEEYTEIAIELGEVNVLRGLGLGHASAGNHRMAAGLYWRAYNLGLTWVLLDLAGLREKQGDLRRAGRLYRRALREGQSYAAHGLVRVLELTGHGQAAEKLANRSYDTVETLARVRGEHGQRESAELLLRALVAKGHTEALLTLGQIRRAAGDRAGAELAFRQAIAAGVDRALAAGPQCVPRRWRGRAAAARPQGSSGPPGQEVGTSALELLCTQRCSGFSKSKRQPASHSDRWFPWTGIPPASFSIRARWSWFQVMKVVLRLVKSFSGPPEPGSR